jgi:hypothetical protein
LSKILTEVQLSQFRAAGGGITWTSPASPQGMDWGEVYIGLAMIPHDHPPSLKNPLKTKIPLAQDGWKKGDSKEARHKALADLVEIQKRMRRQIGKPEIAQTALYPLFPNISQWT